MIKKRITDPLVWDGSITVKDVIEKEVKSGCGIKITHDEGYFSFHLLEKDGKVFIYEQVFDFINNSFYKKTICEVENGKTFLYKRMEELYGDF